MQLLNILAGLVVIVSPFASSSVLAASIIEARVVKSFTLVIHGNQSQLGGIYHLPIDGTYFKNGTSSQLIAATGTAHPVGTKFTLSNGSLHWNVRKKRYSTRTIEHGSSIVGVPGKSTNDHLIINGTSGYLSFKPHPMRSSQYDFRLCQLHAAPGTYKYVAALGDIDGHTCYAIFLKAVY